MTSATANRTHQPNHRSGCSATDELRSGDLGFFGEVT
jgi:hypothetical protein